MSNIKLVHSGGNSVSLTTPDSNPAANRTLKVPGNADGTILTDTYKPVFFARNNNNQSISNNTSTKIQFDAEVFDSHGYYDHSTNYRFTPQLAGYYYITASIYYVNVNNVYAIDIKKNGSRYVNCDFRHDFAASRSAFISSLVSFNGSSDYVEIFGYHTTGSSITIGNGTQYSITEFSGHYVRALV